MSRARSIPLLSVFLVLLICVHSRGAEISPWREIHSTHFTVITDAGENRGREVALRFEQMRTEFAILLSKDRLNQSIPLTILALNNDQAYYQLAPLRQGQPIDVPGFFLPGEDQDFIVLNMSEPESWRAVARDLSLMFLNCNYPPAQGWFDEGLAEYFSSIRVDNKQVEIGADPDARRPPSANTQDQSDPHSTKSLTELLGGETWIPLTDLFAAKHAASVGVPVANPTIYEAESWAVVHYLLHEKRLPEIGTYFGLVLNQHLKPEEAIQQAYGMSATQLEKTVKDYFQARSTSGLVDRSPVSVGPEDSTVTSKSMPESDARVLYAGIQVRIPERRDIGLKTLHDFATAPTEADKKAEAKQQTKRVGEDDQLPSNSVGNALAHRILAWDHIQHGQFEDAFAEIGDAISLNPRDMWAHYYFAAAKYRMAQAKHAEISGLANMLLDLKAVLEWNPEMADAYDLLALARNAGGTTTAAMQSERAAINLSPRDERYSYHLAQIYVASKKWEAADALLQRLKTSSNPQIVAEATDLESKSGAERKYGIPINSSASSEPKYQAQKTPFDILDEDAAKREAAENAHAGTGDKRVTKFVKGRLVAVDCSNAPAAILTVTSDGGVLKLHATDYRALLLIGIDNFSCDWRNRQVTVNYKPGGAADGDLVSLEMR